jgi:hypothetical protein
MTGSSLCQTTYSFMAGGRMVILTAPASGHRCGLEKVEFVMVPVSHTIRKMETI